MRIANYIRRRLAITNLRQIFIYTTVITLLSSPFTYHWLTTLSYHQQQKQGKRYGKLHRPENISRKLDDGLYRSVHRSASTLSLPLPCDEECRRFGRLLDAWPADKPKAAIIVLLGPWSIDSFARSSRLFSANFNDAFNYPVIVFHEENMNSMADHQQLRSFTNSSLYFQVVHFEIPSFVKKSMVTAHCPCCWKSVGYRHMCRFHAKTVYEQPILSRLQYVWRLDDDSYITKPIRYDVFRLMRDRRIQYGYARIVGDYPGCYIHLWPAVMNYINRHNLRPKFYLSRGQTFWNNFELSDLDVWRSPEYREYIDYIDKLGGIYYYRWGDSSIKTIAARLFIWKKHTHYFDNIGYRHGRYIKPKLS